MVERRHLLSGGILGGWLATLASDPAEAAQSSNADRENAQIVARSIDLLRQEIARERDEVSRQRVFAELVSIRDLQLKHLVGSGKFPDFIELGTDTWFQVHDWHIRWNQPLNLGRDLLNRPTLTLMQTTLIMRPDQKEFVGIPYDVR